MKTNTNKRKHGFTLVELVIVIAVIGVLTAILIPTISDTLDKAQEVSAISSAKTAWESGLRTLNGDYYNFVGYRGELNGWIYDSNEGVAKYHVKDKYTVSYNGKEFTIGDYDGALPTLPQHYTIEETGDGDSIKWNR